MPPKEMPMRSKRALFSAAILFLVLEICMGILIFGPNMGDVSRGARFGAVCIALVFCALFFERTLEYGLTMAAFLLAVCADGFLALPAAPIQLPGVLLFSAAYLVYALRLYLCEPGRGQRRAHVIARITVPTAALLAAVLVLRERCDALALASVFCYANLALNLLFAALRFRRQAALALGFLLLFISDTVLGLTFITPYIPMSTRSMPYRMVHAGFDLIWAFYLPAQILLAFSLFAKRWHAAQPACRKASSEPASTL
jgi:hypothetical protein